MPQSVSADSMVVANKPPPHDLGAAGDWIMAQGTIVDCRPTAEQALRTGMQSVEILRGMGMDAQGLLAALLQPLAPFTDEEQALLAARFGSGTLALLLGAARMRQLSLLSEPAAGGKGSARAAAHEENLRKMLIAMLDDVRVALIELARHLSALRRCKDAADERRGKLARATIEVYAPLANRLGARQLKWRMEDYALRFLEADAYHELAAALSEKRADRETYIQQFIQVAQDVLKAASIAAEVHGRPKHLYSIWKKMRGKSLPFEGLLDIRAARILVDNVVDCYAALAAVHAAWRGLPEGFDDYIATPKDNGYQSIHTVIMGPLDKVVEVQIRTHEMHRQSELGVAAHWRYKEGARADDSLDSKVLRLRQLLRWKAEMLDAGVLSDYPQAAMEDERVYAFTPRGMVIDLPGGATPIDFAYAIHTDIGHSIRGAKVNGKMAPLGRRLQSGDQVNIQTVKGGKPSRDWLRPELGQVRTRRARSRIAQWFKRASFNQRVAEGRGLLERELSRLGLADLGYDKIARQGSFNKTDDLLAALGSGDFKLSKALAPFHSAASEPLKPRRRRPLKQPDNFKVSGVGNLLTRMANCCKPIPGDAIVGFISVGRGVSIHRRDCNNMRNLAARLVSRLVEVAWSETEPASYAVEIHLTAYHRSGLLNDITQLLKDERVEVLLLNMDTDSDDNAHIQLRLEAAGLNQLQQLLRRLSRVPNVLAVRRATS